MQMQTWKKKKNKKTRTKENGDIFEIIEKAGFRLYMKYDFNFVFKNKK